MLKTLHARNSLFIIGLASLAAALGSILTFMLATTLFTAVYFLFEREKFKLVRSDWWLIIPGLAFYLTMAASLIRPGFELSDVTQLVPPLLFLCIIFALIVLRSIKNADYFSLFIKYAPYCGVFLIPLLIYNWYAPAGRFSGGGGNPIPFAMICALYAPICLLSAIGASKKHQLLSYFGAALLILGLLLSQTRSMYLAMFFNLTLVFVYMFLQSSRKSLTAVISVVIIACAGTVVANNDAIYDRGKSLFILADNVSQGKFVLDNSIGLRVILYKRGWCLFEKAPLWGYGIGKRDDILAQGKQDAVVDGAVLCPAKHPGFSHFHNGFLTAAIDAGIFGVLATLLLFLSPIIFVFVSPNDGLRPKRFVFASVISITYFFAGMTNILFGQDLVDSLFIVFSLVLALSVVKTDEPSTEDANELTISIR
jgi:O-antigen ligase